MDKRFANTSKPQQHPEDHRKLVYCSRTVPEIDKALAELRRLMAYRKKEGLEEEYFGIGLTSRKNLCLHPVVSKERKGKVVDSKCRNMTASWIRSKAGKGKQAQESGEAMDVDTNIELCDFYEVWHSFSRRSCPLTKSIPDSNLMLQTLPILYPVAYIPSQTWKTIAKRWDSAHITSYDEQYVSTYTILMHFGVILINSDPDSFRKRRHIFLPLHARSKGCWTCIERAFQRLHCCIWWST